MNQDIKRRPSRMLLGGYRNTVTELWSIFDTKHGSITGGTISFSKEVSNGHMSVHETWRSGERVCYVTCKVNDRVSTIVVPEEWTNEDLWLTLNSHENILDGIDWLKHATMDELRRIHLMSKLQ